MKWLLSMLVVCLFMAGFLSLFASPEPDGLERVAEDHGFLELEKEVFESPMPGYAVSGIGNDALAGSLAGVFGTVLMLGLALWIGNSLK